MGGLALIQGLLKAKKTGKGFYIDYSVTEGAMSMLGTYMLDYQVNGRRTRRPDFPPGNRSIFPAAGAAQHLPLRRQGPQRAGLVGLHRVRDAAAVRVALRAHGPAGSRRSIRSSRPTKRAWRNQDELDAIIGRWTRARRRYDIMRKCQAAGIIAAVVQSAEDRVEYDPQLQHREMHPIINHPEIGDVRVRGLSGEDVAHAGLRARARADAGRAQRLRLRRAAGHEQGGDRRRFVNAK